MTNKRVLLPDRFLEIRTDRKPRAKFCLCVPLNLTCIKGVGSLTTGLHTTDLIFTVALGICLSVNFRIHRNLAGYDSTLVGVICTMFFGPLVVRALTNLTAVTASYFLLMEEKRRRQAKNVGTFVAGLLDRIKTWLVVMFIVQVFQLAAAVVLFSEALKSRMAAMQTTSTDTQIVYIMFVSFHIIMTVVSVVFSYYLWRCGLFYYLAMSGFFYEIDHDGDMAEDENYEVNREARRSHYNRVNGRSASQEDSQDDESSSSSSDHDSENLSSEEEESQNGPQTNENEGQASHTEAAKSPHRLLIKRTSRKSDYHTENET